MTTEEALAVADSVQWSDEWDAAKDARLAAARGDQDKKEKRGRRRRLIAKDWRSALHKGDTKGMDDFERELDDDDDHKYPPDHRSQPTGGHTIHVHGDGHTLHFSDAEQFAEATKQRLDAAERQAMRRAIAKADIHPAIKLALLRHAEAVQFSDAGREIPSVPLSWIVQAAQGILQVEALGTRRQ